MLGALAAAVAGHYLAAFGRSVVGVTAPSFVGDSGPMTLAVVAIGIVWWLQRQGRPPLERNVARAIGASVAVLLLVVCWATVSALLASTPRLTLHAPPGGPLALATALGFALSALGSVESLSQAAVDLEQPRIRNLQRVARLVNGYGIVITAALAFLFAVLVRDQGVWTSAPLAGLASQLTAPPWLRLALVSLVAAAAAVFLAATLRSTTRGAYTVLARLVDEGFLDDRWRALHHRFGTPWRSIDAVALVQVAIVLLSGGGTAWIARAYAIAVVVSAVLKLAALIRYRSIRKEKRAYRAPLNVTIGGHEWPLGLIGAAVLLVLAAAGLLAVADPPSLAGGALVAALTIALVVSKRSVASQPESGSALDEFQLLPSDDVDLRHVAVRPGNFLVPVRRPHVLTHLVSALRAAGDRDVVAMTVRLVGVDVPDDPTQDPRATDGGAAAAVGGDGGRRARRPSRPPDDRARRERLRLGDRNRAPAEVVGNPHGRIRNTLGRRPGEAAGRRPGNAPASRPASTSVWSSITLAATPPRITWARMRPLSAPKTSNTSTGSGSTSSGPLVRACTITMWYARR